MLSHECLPTRKIFSLTKTVLNSLPLLAFKVIFSLLCVWAVQYFNNEKGLVSPKEKFLIAALKVYYFSITD